jgi:small subunit ribosomal protein S8
MTEQTTPTTPAPETEPTAQRAAPAPGVKKPASTRKPRPKVVGVPNDPVADMLTRIRNGAGARHETVSMPTSRTKIEIAKILKTEGFISSFEQPSQRELVVKMKYIGGKVSAVSGIRRISKPGLRVYARKTEIPRVLGGLGIVIVSTSRGIMTGAQAHKAELGGEILAYVW